MPDSLLLARMTVAIEIVVIEPTCKLMLGSAASVSAPMSQPMSECNRVTSWSGNQDGLESRAARASWPAVPMTIAAGPSRFATVQCGGPARPQWGRRPAITRPAGMLTSTSAARAR